MERSVLGVKNMDRLRNTTLRSKTLVADVSRAAARRNRNWTGHIPQYAPREEGKYCYSEGAIDHRRRGRLQHRGGMTWALSFMLTGDSYREKGGNPKDNSLSCSGTLPQANKIREKLIYTGFVCVPYWFYF